jgi:predicted RNase H-like HicB family nuclease
MRKYAIVIEKTDYGYSAYVPDLPGCVSTANTKSEVEQLMYEGIQFHIEGMILEGYEIPEPTTEVENILVPA